MTRPARLTVLSMAIAAVLLLCSPRTSDAYYYSWWRSYSYSYWGYGHGTADYPVLYYPWLYNQYSLGQYGYGYAPSGYGYWPYGWGYNWAADYPFIYYPWLYGQFGTNYCGTTAGFSPMYSYQVGYVQQPAGPATATLEVHVPANADVFFDNVKSTQTGTLRRYTAPALSPGETAVVEFRATWKDDNGKDVNQLRKVQLQPSQQLVINMTP